MKRIIAFIKPNKLSAANKALHGLEGLTGISMSNIRGFGRGRAKDAVDRVSVESTDFIISIRLEIYCSDEVAHQVVNTINENTHTGLRGDGKIYISNVQDAVRISTGERGEAAV
jgi:nitrogen regulatory protein PII